MEPDKRRYINVYLDNATLERIDEYRFENRFASRTDAIRRLLNIALGNVPPKASVSRPPSRKVKD